MYVLNQPSTRRVDPILLLDVNKDHFPCVDPCSRQRLYRRDISQTIHCRDLTIVSLSCGMPHFLKQSTKAEWSFTGSVAFARQRQKTNADNHRNIRGFLPHGVSLPHSTQIVYVRFVPQ